MLYRVQLLKKTVLRTYAIQLKRNKTVEYPFQCKCVNGGTKGIPRNFFNDYKLAYKTAQAPSTAVTVARCRQHNKAFTAQRNTQSGC